MKKVVAASLFLFWAVVTAILTAGLVFYGQQQSLPPGSNQTAALGSLTLTPAEVAKHSSPGSCWLIVNGKVYDVSGYLSIHPGNPGTITPYCGKEATVAFDTQDRGKPHSAAARALLNLYYIGDLNQQVVQQPQAPPTGGAVGRNHEFEDDD